MLYAVQLLWIDNLASNRRKAKTDFYSVKTYSLKTTTTDSICKLLVQSSFDVMMPSSVYRRLIVVFRILNTQPFLLTMWSSLKRLTNILIEQPFYDGIAQKNCKTNQSLPSSSQQRIIYNKVANFITLKEGQAGLEAAKDGLLNFEKIDDNILRLVLGGLDISI